MKIVNLAGGLGTRISKETSTRPEPMVKIGGRPILWHTIENLFCPAIIFDGRNLFEPAYIKTLGIEYCGIGRGN